MKEQDYIEYQIYNLQNNKEYLKNFEKKCKESGLREKFIVKQHNEKKSTQESFR